VLKHADGLYDGNDSARCLRMAKVRFAGANEEGLTGSSFGDLESFRDGLYLDLIATLRASTVCFNECCVDGVQTNTGINVLDHTDLRRPVG
jgi:hypothetical protein